MQGLRKRVEHVERVKPRARRFFAFNIGDTGELTENGEPRTQADLMQAKAQAQKENCEVHTFVVVYTAVVSDRTKQARRESPALREVKENAETSF